MKSAREGKPRRPKARHLALWAGLAVGSTLPAMVGCQVEYAGMTLPSGKYLYDDVQYFPPGPDFPWANTNAATQRARMQAMGMDVSGMPVPGSEGTITPPRAAGALDPSQAGPGGANINVMQNPPGGAMIPPPPAPGQNVAPHVPLPGGDVAAPPRF
jgi:hypothetical protein